MVEEHHQQMQLQHRLRERHSREREPRTQKDEKSSVESTKASPESHPSLIHHRQHHQHWSPLTANPSQLVNPATGKKAHRHYTKNCPREYVISLTQAPTNLHPQASVAFNAQFVSKHFVTKELSKSTSAQCISVKCTSAPWLDAT